MLNLGLIDELTKFHQDYNALRLSQHKTPDYTEGIFQTIGLKEFHKYLMLTPEERSSFDGSRVLGHASIDFKERTRSYVSKQLKWIRRRFLVDEAVRSVPNVYRLDTTDPDEWPEKVYQKAIQIVDANVEALLTKDQTRKGEIYQEILNPLAEEPLANKEQDSFISAQHFCELCEMKISGGKGYQEHLASKGHKWMVKHCIIDKN